MSNVSEAEAETDRISGYSDVTQRPKKIFNFAKESFSRVKIPDENSAQTEESEDIFSPDQIDAILCDLRTYPRPVGLKITNCIFRRDHVEICYYLDDVCGVHTKDNLRQQLADHLKIDSKTIKVTKLRSKPIYTETTLRPGESATLGQPPQGSCKIGAFVEVDGKGNHALMSGHGKSEGDVLFYPNGDRLGVVNVALHPPLQPTNSEHWCSYYSDVALARLEEQGRYIAKVSNDIQGPMGLMEQPIYATNNMTVRCFTLDGRKGNVDSTDYVTFDDTFKIAFRLISVVSENGGPIHEEGDSGILIVTDTPVNGKVKAVGNLVRLERMDEENEVQRPARVTSLAVPLQANFDALRKHSYCNGAAIQFLS